MRVTCRYSDVVGGVTHLTGHGQRAVLALWRLVALTPRGRLVLLAQRHLSAATHEDCSQVAAYSQRSMLAFAPYRHDSTSKMSSC